MSSKTPACSAWYTTIFERLAVRERELLAPHERLIANATDRPRRRALRARDLGIDEQVGQLARAALEASGLHPIPGLPRPDFVHAGRPNDRGWPHIGHELAVRDGGRIGHAGRHRTGP